MTELNFVNGYQISTLLSASSSDLLDIWKNQFEGKKISFSVDNIRKGENEMILTRIVLDVPSYFTWCEDESFVDGIEFVVSNPLGRYFSKNTIVEIVGTLISCEKLENDDTQTGCKSAIRIHVESSSITPDFRSSWGSTSR